MKLLALDAGTVVGHANAFDAATTKIDIDLRCARIERIFEELLQRRRRAFDDLAGGDLIDQVIGQRADRHRQIASALDQRAYTSSATACNASMRAGRSRRMSSALCTAPLDFCGSSPAPLASHVATRSGVISMWHWKPMCRSSTTYAW